MFGIVMAACTESDAPTGDAALLTPAPIGGGYCCPIETIMCNCFHHGGWVPERDLEACPRICDMGAGGAYREPDAHGCQVQKIPTSCL